MDYFDVVLIQCLYQYSFGHLNNDDRVSRAMPNYSHGYAINTILRAY
jgi:hypothetical protein